MRLEIVILVLCFQKAFAMKSIYYCFLLTTLLTACAGTESPLMIASHPADESTADYPLLISPNPSQTII